MESFSNQHAWLQKVLEGIMQAMVYPGWCNNNNNNNNNNSNNNNYLPISKQLKG